MDSRRTKTVQLFLVLALVHTAVFVVFPFTFDSYNDRVNWLAINAVPWWPLYKLGLPVAYHDWLVRPNLLGWLWCAGAWVVFYGLVARWIIRLVSRYRERA